MLIQIKNGRVIDPSQSIDRVAELWIDGKRILGIGPQPQARADQVIDATGRIVCPGLIDMHVHLREPGREEDETIATGAAAALAGGVASVACMPNTEPPLDTPEMIQFVRRQAEQANAANVFPVAAVTRARQGNEVGDLARLADAGAVAFSDDGSPVMNSAVMRQALEICRTLNKAILSHAEDIELTRGGVANEGPVSRQLSVKGLPALAEDILVFREIALAELTGGRMHICHVSTAGSVDLIRRGKQRGVRISGEACPHHFTLTDECLLTGDSNYKMAPPLRTAADVQAVIEGLKDGTIEALATDHAPHSPDKKARGLAAAPNGILGVETLLPICIHALIEPGHLTWPQVIAKLTIDAARIVGIDKGTLKPGSDADVTIIDPSVAWTIDVTKFRSKSRNCPFHGWKVHGRATAVIVRGEVKETFV
jgi:dihydroorotase